MRHGSLFSGIGGFDLAAEWMGWENIFHCEWNEFGKKVLNYYWPNAISYDDITKTDFSIHRGRIDILTGGFPCQPYSQAGKRLGKEDSRHLWPEMLRAIRQVRPTWVVGENVYGLLNWSEGLVFDEVQTDLEKEGYTVQPYILPACGVNAPHGRKRIWFIAYANKRNDGRTSRENETKSRKKRVQQWNKIRKFNKSNKILRFISNSNGQSRKSKISRWKKHDKRWNQIRNIINTNGRKWNVTNSNSGRRIQNNQKQQTRQFKQNIPSWGKFPTQTPICNGDDGLSSQLDSITFPKWRSESIKAGGNAIVPQVALQIFKTIVEHEKVL